MRIPVGIGFSMKTVLLLAILPMMASAEDKPNQPASQPISQPAAQPSAPAKQQETSKPVQAPIYPQAQDLRISAGDLAKAGAIAGGVGGVLAAIIGAIVAYFNRAHEDRKHIRELAIQMALEQWRAEQQAQGAFLAKHPTAIKAEVNPLQPVVDNMFAFVEGMERRRRMQRGDAEELAAIQRVLAARRRRWFKRKK